MPKTRPAYTEEFRQQAVQLLLDSGRPLDRDGKGVVNHSRDARELALALDRYVRGNAKAHSEKCGSVAGRAFECPTYPPIQ
ncbi:MAG: transposase [Verrucomicrobiales bacterium]|nr:transposase [Verrucomicrobiales bacterium]